MKIGAFVSALLLAAAAVAGQPWPKEPNGFAGVPWGANRKDADAVLQFRRCTDIDEDRVYCTGSSRGPGLTAGTFYRDRLVAITVSFASLRFDEIKGIFLEKYGRPAQTDRPVLQNRMGAHFTDERLGWQGKRIVLVLDKYGEDLETGTAMFSTLEWERILERLAREKAKKQAKDF